MDDATSGARKNWCYIFSNEYSITIYLAAASFTILHCIKFRED